MNRMKYRVWLILLVIAATLFGILYYTYGEKEQRLIQGARWWSRKDSPGRFGLKGPELQKL